MSFESTVKFTCQNPDCHPEADGSARKYQWVDGYPESAPDGAARILLVKDMAGNEWGFCGNFCVSEWARKHHTPLKSPREQKEAQLASEQAAKDTESKQLHLVDQPGVTPSEFLPQLEKKAAKGKK